MKDYIEVHEGGGFSAVGKEATRLVALIMGPLSACKLEARTGMRMSRIDHLPIAEQIVRKHGFTDKLPRSRRKRAAILADALEALVVPQQSAKVERR